ncbi:MAG TPA: hypothetical protein VED46_18620, partial [Alphaproteobacteria bacterium]|nr:hypothetical protein [Alphaproteobacteria bacterium]
TPLKVEASEPARPAAPMPDIGAVLAITAAELSRSELSRPEPPKPESPRPESPRRAPVTRPDLHDDFQSEIKARVANFRAHQERFNREREAYCSATMAKVHAALQEGPQPPRPGK